VLYVAYAISLFLCFVTTGVTPLFGYIPRLQDKKFLSRFKPIVRRTIICGTAMIIAVVLSQFGIYKVIQYGYGYAGAIGAFAVVLPMLTVGVYKNRKFAKENQQATVANSDNP
jgi:uncharacterized membrane protein YkvI